MNKKEYTLQINGITTSIKEVTSLNKVLEDLDKKAKGMSNIKSGDKHKVKAITDEEKAAKKLADTQKKLNDINSESTKTQILATQQLRERTREVSREIALNQLAEGSIKAMGMELTNLRNEYEGLSEEQRSNIEVGGKLLEQIQALDTKYKGLRERTGNFRDSVGNYEKALSGLNKLDKGLGKVNNTVTNLSTAFAGNVAILGLFGSITKTSEKAQADLAKIVALVTVAQELSTAATSKGIIVTTAKNAIDKVSIIQLRAKTIAEALATKGTIAATVAQAAFNVVAYANPYVLLAMALVGLVAALAVFSDNTKEAAEAQQELNDAQQRFMDKQDEEGERIKFNSKLRIDELTRQLELLKAQGKPLKEIQAIEKEIQKERMNAKAALKGTYFAYKEYLDKAVAETERLKKVLEEVTNSKSSTVKIKVDPNLPEVKMKTDDALKAVEDRIKMSKQNEIRIRVAQNDYLNQENEGKILEERHKKELQEQARQNEQKAKQAKEDAKRRAEEARRNAQERASIELEAFRKMEDLKNKLAGETYAVRRKIIESNYNREKEDIEIRLKNETHLTIKAREALNAQIVLLEKIKKKELEELSREIARQEIQTEREKQDVLISLTRGSYDKRLAETNAYWDRYYDDLLDKYNNEKSLTQTQKNAIWDMIQTVDEQRQRAIDNLAVENSAKMASAQIQAVEEALSKAQDKIGSLVKRSNGLIDVEATRESIRQENEALDKYVEGYKEYQNQLTITHYNTLSKLKEGTSEYIEEQNKYSSAYRAAGKKIEEAQKEQTENTRAAVQAQKQYYKELFEAIANYAQEGSDAIGMVTDALNQGIQASLDSLNEQLDATNEKYEKAKELREKYAKDVEDIEARVQNATGASADVLREQLQDAMHARDEAAREEQRQAKEKEKLEAEVAKKEKQMKRNELISNIAMAAANVAQAVTKALTAGPFIGQFMAGIAAAIGSAQIAIMTKQLAKLEKGGPIIGPSHANGGVNILVDGKPSYEAQGGEFMVNDKSYSNNKTLVEFLNASPDPLTAADLVGIVPGFEALPVVDTPNRSNNIDIIEAIKGIDFKPVVSVTDIIEVSDRVTTVQDLAGV